MTNPPPEQVPPDEVLLTKDVAELLRVSVPTVDRLVRDEQLRPFYVGRSRRFHRSEVNRFMRVEREPER